MNRWPRKTPVQKSNAKKTSGKLNAALEIARAAVSRTETAEVAA